MHGLSGSLLRLPHEEPRALRDRHQAVTHRRPKRPGLAFQRVSATALSDASARPLTLHSGAMHVPPSVRRRGCLVLSTAHGFLDASMFFIPQTPYERHHIQSAFSVGQGQPSLFFWARRFLVPGAFLIPAVTDNQRHTAQSLQCHDLSLFMIGYPHFLPTRDTRCSLHF